MNHLIAPVFFALSTTASQAHSTTMSHGHSTETWPLLAGLAILIVTALILWRTQK